MPLASLLWDVTNFRICQCNTPHLVEELVKFKNPSYKSLGEDREITHFVMNRWMDGPTDTLMDMMDGPTDTLMDMMDGRLTP